MSPTIPPTSLVSPRSIALLLAALLGPACTVSDDEMDPSGAEARALCDAAIEELDCGVAAPLIITGRGRSAEEDGVLLEDLDPVELPNGLYVPPLGEDPGNIYTEILADNDECFVACRMPFVNPSADLCIATDDEGAPACVFGGDATEEECRSFTEACPY